MTMAFARRRINSFSADDAEARVGMEGAQQQQQLRRDKPACYCTAVAP